MRLGLLAKKVGMSRFYDSSGINHPVTILKVDEANVVDIKQTKKWLFSSQIITWKIKRKKQIYYGFSKKKCSCICSQKNLG